MSAIEVSELSPCPPKNSSQARILADARDVFNHESTLNSIAGDIHYHQCSHGSTDPGLARPAESPPTSHRKELPSQLYSRLLLQEGRGYPLMDPTLPNELPAEYQSQGVMIGDVGVVSEDGYFDVLFNICEPADGSINSGYVPEGFVTLQRPPDNRYNYRRGRSYGMGGYTVSDPGIRVNSPPLGAFMDYSDDFVYRFQCGSGEGAILALPLGASREDLLHRKDFLDYALKHGVRWYEFVSQTLGRAIDNGSIYLITGFDKARTWGTASFPASSALASSPIHFTKAGWSSYGPATVKYGKNLGSGTPQENQCIFLRGYRVTLSNRILSKMFGISVVEASPMDRAPLEHDQLSLFSLLGIGKDLAAILGNMIRKDGTPACPAILEGNSDVDRPIVTSTTSPLSSGIHPSNLVNLYLLSKFPECDLAVTHDSVWCSYLKLKLESEHQTLAPFFEYVDARYTTKQESGAIYLAGPEERFDKETDISVSIITGGSSPMTDEVSSDVTTTMAVSLPAIADPPPQGSAHDSSAQPFQSANRALSDPSYEGQHPITQETISIEQHNKSTGGQNRQYTTSSPDQLSRSNNAAFNFHRLRNAVSSFTAPSHGWQLAASSLPEQLWSNSAAFSSQRPHHAASPFTVLHGSQSFASSPTVMQESSFLHTSMQEEQDGNGETKEQAKVKPGACARCKTLKVKCEFKAETETCKRCLNSGNECILSGGRERQTPLSSPPLDIESSGACARCKVLKLKCEFEHEIACCKRCLNSGSDCVIPGRRKRRTPPKRGYLLNQREQADYLEKLMVLDQDLENPNGSDDDENFYDPHDGESVIAAEHEEEDPASGQDSGRPRPGKLRHRSSVSSTNSHSTTGSNNGKMSADNSSPATLPGEAAPFGLLGKLGLKTRNQSIGSEDEGEGPAPSTS